MVFGDTSLRMPPQQATKLLTSERCKQTFPISVACTRRTMPLGSLTCRGQPHAAPSHRNHALFLKVTTTAMSIKDTFGLVGGNDRAAQAFAFIRYLHQSLA